MCLSWYVTPFAPVAPIENDSIGVFGGAGFGVFVLVVARVFFAAGDFALVVARVGVGVELLSRSS